MSKRHKKPVMIRKGKSTIYEKAGTIFVNLAWKCGKKTGTHVKKYPVANYNLEQLTIIRTMPEYTNESDSE